MNVPTYIRNPETVVKFFGHWPAFHDAKVHAYELDPDVHSISLTLHHALMTDELDARGYFVLRNHGLVSFRFDGIRDLQMNAFKAENILFGLELSPCSDSDSFHVLLDSVMDMSGSFSARSGEIISVIPCTPTGEPT